MLERLGLQAEDCNGADAWWGIDGDATLLESCVGDGVKLMANHWKERVALHAVFDAPFVTRSAFEDAMVRFADAGFPRDPKYQLNDGDPPLVLPGGPPAGR